MYSPVCSSTANRARPRRCSSMPRCATGAAGWSSTGSAASANASCATGQEIPACRAASAGVIPALGDLGAGLLAQPGRDPAPRRQARHPLGERLAQAFRVAALAPDLDPPHVYPVPGPAHIPRPGQHRLMHPARDRAAIRARRRGRIIGDRPYLHRAARPGLHVGDLQALHPEQRRRRILEHDARGFLVILMSVRRPKIVGAAGSQATATRQLPRRSRQPAKTCPAHSVTPVPRRESPASDNVPANFEEPHNWRICVGRAAAMPRSPMQE